MNGANYPASESEKPPMATAPFNPTPAYPSHSTEHQGPPLPPYPAINEQYMPQPPPLPPPPPYSVHDGYHPPSGVFPNAMPTAVLVKEAKFVTMLGTKPCCVNCPHCHKDIVTTIDYQSGLLTWLFAIGLCVLGLVAGCCLIPFCINGCKNVVHFCPNCSYEIGRHNRL